MTREQVVATAADILATGAPGAFSMRTLAARLDMSPMAIYHYFDSKSDLLGAVLEHQAWRSPVPALPDGPRDRLVALGSAIVDHLAGHPWVVDVLAGEESLDARSAWVFEEFLATASSLGADPATASRAAQGVWRIALGEVLVRSSVGERAARGRAAWFDDDVPARVAELPRLASSLGDFRRAARHYDVRDTLRGYLAAAIP